MQMEDDRDKLLSENAQLNQAIRRIQIELNQAKTGPPASPPESSFGGQPSAASVSPAGSISTHPIVATS